MALEGDNVDQQTADKVNDAIQRAIKALEKLPHSPEQQEAIANCLNTLGALAALETLDLDTDAAVLSVLDIAKDDAVPHVRKACMTTLGKIAKRPEGVQKIVHHGGIAHSTHLGFNVALPHTHI